VLAAARAEEKNIDRVGAAQFAHEGSHSTREPC
jgi:hypothetical protein